MVDDTTKQPHVASIKRHYTGSLQPRLDIYYDSMGGENPVDDHDDEVLTLRVLARIIARVHQERKASSENSALSGKDSQRVPRHREEDNGRAER